jgi:Protein of unknown function (DUF4058)
LPCTITREFRPVFYRIAGSNGIEIIHHGRSYPLPVIAIPLCDPDPDVPLAIQTALEQVYDDGNYMLRVKYDQPCVPSLAPKDQEWAFERWSAYRCGHPELLLDENTG